MIDATSGSRLGEHAVYPGTFDPTLLLPARPTLAATSSTILRGLGI